MQLEKMKEVGRGGGRKEKNPGASRGRKTIEEERKEREQPSIVRWVGGRKRKKELPATIRSFGEGGKRGGGKREASGERGGFL